MEGGLSGCRVDGPEQEMTRECIGRDSVEENGAGEEVVVGLNGCQRLCCMMMRIRGGGGGGEMLGILVIYRYCIVNITSVFHEELQPEVPT